MKLTLVADVHGYGFDVRTMDSNADKVTINTVLSTLGIDLDAVGDVFAWAVAGEGILFHTATAGLRFLDAKADWKMSTVRVGFPTALHLRRARRDSLANNSNALMEAIR